MSISHSTRTPYISYQDVPGFPGYVVDTLGRVWSYRLKGSATKSAPKWMLSQYVFGKYMRVGLQKDKKQLRYSVHRIVLQAFRGQCPDGHESAHWNGDKLDNRLCNLRWATHTENMADNDRNGVLVNGERHWKAKLSEDDVRRIVVLYKEGNSQLHIGRLYGVNHKTISRIVNGKSWNHLGLVR